MKFSFWGKQAPPILIEERPKRKKTMRSVGEKILIRQLEKTQNVELAEKVMGISGISSTSPGKSGSLVDQLKEHQAINELLGVSGGKSKAGKPGKGVWDGQGTWLSEILNSQAGMIIAEPLAQLLKNMNKAVKEAESTKLPPPGKLFITEPSGRVVEIEQDKIQVLSETPPPKSIPKSIEIDRYEIPQLQAELVNYINMEPSAVISSLRSRDDALAVKALNILRTKSYEEIVEMVSPGFEIPIFGGVIKKVLEERADWLQELIVLAQETP